MAMNSGSKSIFNPVTGSRLSVHRDKKTCFTHFFLGIYISYCLLLIPGCTTFLERKIPDQAVRTILIEPLTPPENKLSDSFNILGRISIQDKDQRTSGSFRWQHSSLTDEILIFTALGQAIAEIIRDQDGVSIMTAKQEYYEAADVESLTEDILGWRLPLGGLQYWIQGAHSPFTAAEKDLNLDDQVITIRQDGWTIQYISYLPKQQYSVPRLLDLSFEDLKLRLIIDDWKILPSATQEEIK